MQALCGAKINEKVLDICCRIWYSIKAVSETLRDKRKTEKFGLEPIEVLKKNLKKVVEKRFLF